MTKIDSSKIDLDQILNIKKPKFKTVPNLYENPIGVARRGIDGKFYYSARITINGVQKYSTHFEDTAEGQKNAMFAYDDMLAEAATERLKFNFPDNWEVVVKKKEANC